MKKKVFDPKRYHRKSIRLKAYDYSKTGLYFITICTKNKVCLFGQITKNVMILNDAGVMIEKEWLNLSERFHHICLHESMVMPNHFHAIYEVKNQKNTNIIGDIVGAFKSISTVEYIRGVKVNNWPPFEDKLWQRNYWEHVIRNENSHQKISNYIQNNPENWKIGDLKPYDPSLP